MAEETIDAGLLEQTKTQIRKLVAEIAELAESDVQPPVFHTEFLNRVVAAVAASGGAIWLLDGRNNLRLNHQVEFRLTGLLDGRVRSQPHDGLLGCMLKATQPVIIPPGAGVEGAPGAGNPTGFALILAPLIVDKQVVGLVEVLMDPNRQAATQKSTLRFINDLCDLAEGYLKNRQMRQIVSQQQLWNQLEGFTHAIHGSLDLKESAYAVVNDGKRLVGCDRLSVALKIGGRIVIEAVSGQEVVEQRANLIRELTKLCKVTVLSGDDLVYTGSTETFAPEIRDALEAYVDESGAKAVVITLLFKPETDPTKDKIAFGALIAEQIGDEVAPTDMHARTEVVARHGSTALWNAREHDKIFLRPLLKMIGTPTKFFRGRTLAKIVAALVAVAAIILILAFVPWKLTIEGRGALWPDNKHNTYAPLPGKVVQVFADHGQKVKEGDPLIKLESKEISKKYFEIIAQREESIVKSKNLANQITKAKADDRVQLQAQLAEEEIKLESAKDQLEILQDQLSSLDIKAPHGGIITTWEPKKNFMNRPVDVGTELLSVLDIEGEWVMDVDIPDDDMGPVRRANAQLVKDIEAGRKKPGSTLSAYFVSATDPEHRYPGYVRKISSKAELVDTKHVVKVTIGFSDKARRDYESKNGPLRPGAEVRARIDCGQARLAYVIFRDVIHVFYETVLFRWPFMN